MHLWRHPLRRIESALLCSMPTSAARRARVDERALPLRVRAHRSALHYTSKLVRGTILRALWWVHCKQGRRHSETGGNTRKKPKRLHDNA